MEFGMNAEKPVLTISRKSLGEAVAGLLREKIIKGQYSPGERLIEEQLSNELGISRFSIRDGLRILESEDLVVHEPNKQTRVVSFTQKKIEDIYTIRLALETTSVDIIEAKGIPVTKLQLDAYTGELKKIRECEKDIYEKLKNVDMQFHETLIRVADNQYCIKIWEMIKNQILMLYSQILKSDSSRSETYLDFAGKHHAIIEALQAGAFAQAKKELHVHMATNTSFFLKAENGKKAAVAD